MKLADWQKTLNDLDAIDPELIEDADIKKELDKLRNKLIRKGKREFEDGSMLKALVEMIEIMGFSQKKTFIFLDSHYFSESKAKKLWFKTKKDNRDKIEELRQQQACDLLSGYMQWLIKHHAEDFPPPYSTLHTHALLHLKSNNTALFDWALKKAFLEFYDIEHEDFEPEYKKSTKDKLSEAYLAFIGHPRID